MGNNAFEKIIVMFFHSRKSHLLAGAVMALLVSSPWAAVAETEPDKVPTATLLPAPAWALNCSSPNAATGGLDCRISLTLRRKETGQILMGVTIGKAPDGAMVLNLTLPHGLYLPSGVSYQVDSGAKNTAVIFSSDQNGAYANIRLTPELLARLKAGSVLNIGLETVSRNPLNIPVSLSGFTAAVARLSSLK
jgi:invasion protein IalB